MYTTSERIRRVKILARELENKKESRLRGGFSALSLALFLLLAGVTRSATGGVQGKVEGTYGTILLYEDAGSYVLVGVIAFALATVTTVLFMHYGEKILKLFGKGGQG